MSGDLRGMIREILAEEIARLRTDGAAARAAPPPRTREEQVRIASDADLAAFVRRLLHLSRDADARREIEQGRWIFRLGDGAPAAPTGGDRRLASPARPAEKVERIERGFLSERQVDALPPDLTRLVIGKAVRLTPLAKDRLRQRGIEIERKG